MSCVSNYTQDKATNFHNACLLESIAFKFHEAVGLSEPNTKWSLLAEFDGEFAKNSQTYAGTGTSAATSASVEINGAISTTAG
jgi:hypothetical protein